MSKWANFLSYQLVWFAVVACAGRGLAGWGLAAAAVFIAVQLGLSNRRALDAQLMAAALAAGLAIDGTLAFAGLLHYAAAEPALPPGGAPLWILALWLSFALTLTRSLTWVVSRPALAMGFGALGAPLAYWGAARAWHAAQFIAPLWRPVAVLALGWALAMLAFSMLARRASAPRSAVPAAAP